MVLPGLNIIWAKQDMFFVVFIWISKYVSRSQLTLSCIIHGTHSDWFNLSDSLPLQCHQNDNRKLSRCARRWILWTFIEFLVIYIRIKTSALSWWKCIGHFMLRTKMKASPSYLVGRAVNVTLVTCSHVHLKVHNTILMHGGLLIDCNVMTNIVIEGGANICHTDCCIIEWYHNIN